MVVTRARALWITGPRKCEVRDEPVPAPRAGEVLVHTRFGAISRGTECLVYRGEVPASEFETMRAPHQAGHFPWPVKYGYISVGVVEDGPVALLDKHVFCLYPHQTRYVVPAEAVVAVPEQVPPGRAVLAANAETALNAIWDADLRMGDRVTVIGAGTLGCLVAWLASRIPGCDVELVDVNPARRQVAHLLGVRFATPEAAGPGAEKVFHASASETGLRCAIDLAGFEGTVVELSWFGDRWLSLPLGGRFHSQRLTLRSSQVGHVSGVQRARWTRRRRLELALSLLADAALDALISGECAFEALPETFAQIDADPTSVLCQRIVYP